MDLHIPDATSHMRMVSSSLPDTTPLRWYVALRASSAAESNAIGAYVQAALTNGTFAPAVVAWVQARDSGYPALAVSAGSPPVAVVYASGPTPLPTPAASPAPAGCAPGCAASPAAGFFGFTATAYSDNACTSALTAAPATVPPCGCGAVSLAGTTYGLRADPTAQSASPSAACVNVYTSGTCAGTSAAGVPAAVGACAAAGPGVWLRLSNVGGGGGPTAPATQCAPAPAGFAGFTVDWYTNAQCTLRPVGVAAPTTAVPPCGCGAYAPLGGVRADPAAGSSSAFPTTAVVAAYASATCAGASSAPVSALVGACTPVGSYFVVLSNAQAGVGGAPAPAAAAADITGPVAGGVVGGLAGVALLAGVAYYLAGAKAAGGAAKLAGAKAGAAAAREAESVVRNPTRA